MVESQFMIYCAVIKFSVLQNRQIARCVLDSLAGFVLFRHNLRASTSALPIKRTPKVYACIGKSDNNSEFGVTAQKRNAVPLWTSVIENTYANIASRRP